VKSADKDLRKRPKVSKTRKIEQISKRELHDFVTEQSLAFFGNLDLPRNFLEVDPSRWDSDQDYLAARQAVLHLKVVNDLAERGVALVKAYTEAALTKDEQQLQDLLLIVSKHRDQMPVFTKEAALNTFVQ